MLGCVVFLVIALSPQIYCGNKLLVEFEIPEKLLRIWGMFQGIGRFAWPLWYISILQNLIFVGLIINKLTISKYKKSALSIIIPILLLVSQYAIDMGGIVKWSKDSMKTIKNGVGLSQLDSNFWDYAFSEFDEVNFVMPWDMSNLQTIQAKASEYDVKIS